MKIDATTDDKKKRKRAPSAKRNVVSVTDEDT